MKMKKARNYKFYSDPNMTSGNKIAGNEKEICPKWNVTP